MKKDITELFVFVDDFCKAVDEWLHNKLLQDHTRRNPTRTTEISYSEIMTTILLYQQSPCKNFKYFYHTYFQTYKSEFPKMLSYNRFLELKKRILSYLVLLVEWYCYNAKNTGISYIDPTSIAVCHPKRIKSNKVFYGLAKLGKTTKGWFYGFKLHLVINSCGEIQSVMLTRGNVDDREPVQSLTERLSGLLFGDKGYIKQELFEALYNRGLKLVTGIKKGMKNKLMILFEKILLRKRSIIETVFSLLKYRFELEHTRHRSVWNFVVHIFSTLATYCMKPTKPSIHSHFLIPS
jgi:hypothetical protein